MNLKDILAEYQLLDLTHSLHPQVPGWDDGCYFNLQQHLDYPQGGFKVQQLTMFAGTGTHMDAPLHIHPEANGIDQIPLSSLCVPLHTLHVNPQTHAQYLITPADITHYEQQHGLIGPDSLVIADTGWGGFWADARAYRNKDQKGRMQFPTFSAASAKLLLERNIAGIGIDTLSPDGADTDFPVHQLILGTGKYIIENVANAALLPATGAFVLALPMKIQEGTEAPLRLVAFLPRHST